MRLKGFGLMVLISFACVACGGGGGGGPAPQPSDDRRITIEGSASLAVGKNLNGSKVTIGEIDITQTTVSGGKINQTEISVPDVNAAGSISFKLEPEKLEDAKLYQVSLSCGESTCQLKRELRAVISGSRLKQGGWNINPLTEAAAQRLAYYLEAAYTESELQAELSASAQVLLKGDVDGSGEIAYEDLLRWDATLPNSGLVLKRPVGVSNLVDQLSSSSDANAYTLKVHALASVNVSALDTSGSAGGISIVGRYAYIADGEAGLQVVDLQTIETPTIVGQLDTPGQAVDVEISGNYAFVLDAGTALHVVNISNPEHPTLETSLSTVATVLALSDGHIFVAGRTDPGWTLWKYDIRTPTLPQPDATYVSDSFTSGLRQIIMQDGKVYVHGSPGALWVLDAQSDTISLISFVRRTENVNYVDVDGRYVYIATYYESGSDLRVLELQATVEGNILAAVASIKLPAISRGIEISNGFAYIVDDTSNVQVVNVQDPTDPVLVGSIKTVSSANAISVSEGYAFVSAEEQGIDIFDIDAPNSPIVVSKFPTLAGSLALDVRSGYAYIIDGRMRGQCLRVLNIEYPVQAVEVGVHCDSFYTGHSPVLRLDPAGAQMVVSRDDYVLDVERFDLASPRLPERNGFFNTFEVNDMTVTNDRIYMTRNEVDRDAGGFFNVFDLGAAMPEIGGATSIGQLPTGGSPKALSIAGNFAYIANHSLGLQVIDIASETEPELVSSLADAGNAIDLVVFDNYAYIVDEGGSFHVADISAPRAPLLVNSIQGLDDISSVVVSNDYAYLSQGSNVIVVDIANPASPRLFGVTRTQGSISDIVVDTSYIYAATGYGLEILRALPAR